VAVTVEAAVTVACSVCGVDYELSARNAREHRRLGIPHVCDGCRHPPKPPDLGRLDAMRQWWLDRYELAELKSWPPL
jgi:hypothetical protein